MSYPPAPGFNACTCTYCESRSETVLGTCVEHSVLYASTAVTYSLSRSIFSAGSDPTRSKSHSFSSMMSSSRFLSSSNFSVLALASTASGAGADAEEEDADAEEEEEGFFAGWSATAGGRLFFFSGDLDGWTLLSISRSCSCSSGSFAEEPCEPLDRPARAFATTAPPRGFPMPRRGDAAARSGAMTRAARQPAEQPAEEDAARAGPSRARGIYRWAPEEATTERPEVLVTSAATVRTHAPAHNANILVSSHPRGSLRKGRMIEVTGR